ncbi:MAG: zinc-ribbon domain-containing protein, partial [Rhodococcus sp. (in: high G+C Gram-positive bacteria)]
MRALICRKCGQKLSFENSLCLNCHSALGFHLPSRSLLVLPGKADDGAAEVEVDGTAWKVCGNL